MWPSLGVELRKGMLALIAAGPGTGKSAVALNFAAQAGVPTLYFSADSDARTQLTRASAVLTGESVADCTRKLDSGKIPKQVEEAPLMFDFSAEPDLDAIEKAMSVYLELYGEYPHLVIVDNLGDVRYPGEGSKFDAQDSVLRWLNGMARKTGSCVVVLHHVTSSFNDTAQPIPQSGVRGQVTQIPSVIITLHRAGSYDEAVVLGASLVKNRGGRSDASGQTVTRLTFDMRNLRITEETSVGNSTTTDGRYDPFG